MSQQHPLPLPWQPNVSPTGLGPRLPGATGMEGLVCPALRPSSCASSSSSSSPCGAGPSVSSLGSHPAPQGEHPSPRGSQAVPSDMPGTGRRSGGRSRLCTLTGRISGCHHPEVVPGQLGTGQGAQCKPGAEASPSQCSTTNHPGSSTSPALQPSPACSTPCKAPLAGGDPIHPRGKDTTTSRARTPRLPTSQGRWCRM